MLIRPPLLVALAAAFVALGPAPSAVAAHSAAHHRTTRSGHRCPRGQRKAGRGRRSTCIRLKLSTSTSTERHLVARVAAPLLNHLRPRRLPKRLRRVRIAVPAKQLDAGRRKLFAHFGQAHAAAAESTPFSQASQQGGWDQIIEGAFTVDPDTGAVSLRGDLKRSKTKDGLTTTYTNEPTEQRSFGLCPDAQGRVPGHLLWDDVTSVDVKGGRMEMTARIEDKTEVVAEAHTAADGSFHDFDLTQTSTLFAFVAVKIDGRVVESSEPMLYKVVMVRKGLAPDFKLDDLDNGLRVPTAIEPGGNILHSLFGKQFTLNGIGRSVYDEAGTKFPAAARLTASGFKDAERAWQYGACVKVTVSAPQQTLKPGESLTATVTLDGPAKPLAPAQLKIKTYDIGQVAPTSASWTGSPVSFAVTAPSDFKSGQILRVVVNSVSKQGLAFGSLELKPDVPPSYTLRLSSETTETFTGGINGTGSADWAAGGSATLSNASGTWTGQGPVDWAAFSYTQNDIPTLCQDGTTIHSNRTGTSTDPGSLIVDTATIDAADPTATIVTLHDIAPVEHYHTDFFHDQSLCQDYSSDGTMKLWDYHFQLLPVADSSSHSTFTDDQLVIGGWQAGSGSVFATKDVTFPHDDGGGASATTHVHLELVQG